MKQKKVPLRMCKGCNEMKPKKELIRIVKTPEGKIELDDTGKKNGRGVYVCRNIECFEKAMKGRRFEKELSCQISREIYEVIESELRKLADNKYD